MEFEYLLRLKTTGGRTVHPLFIRILKLQKRSQNKIRRKNKMKRMKNCKLKKKKKNYKTDFVSWSVGSKITPQLKKP